MFENINNSHMLYDIVIVKIPPLAPGQVTVVVSLNWRPVGSGDDLPRSTVEAI